MITLQINETVDLTITLPQSESSHAPTYEIFDSDGTVLKSGSLEFVRDEVWKASDFTPTAFGIIVFKAANINTYFTDKRQNIYRVGGNA